MHGMKNISITELLWMWQWSSRIRKRRVTHSNSARHGLPWDMTFSHVLMNITPCRLVNGYGRFDGTVVPSSWTAGPEDEVKLTCRQGETLQMTWIFTNTAVRISQPPTVVPKRRQETVNRRCVKSQRGADLEYTAFKAWNHATVEVLHFLLSACQENAQTEVGRVFSSLCCSLMLIISDIRKLSHYRWRARRNRLKSVNGGGWLWWNFTVKNRRLNTALWTFWQRRIGPCSVHV